jgi:hypothetical protein
VTLILNLPLSLYSGVHNVKRFRKSTKSVEVAAPVRGGGSVTSDGVCDTVTPGATIVSTQVQDGSMTTPADHVSTVDGGTAHASASPATKITSPTARLPASVCDRTIRFVLLFVNERKKVPTSYTSSTSTVKKKGKGKEKRKESSIDIRKLAPQANFFRLRRYHWG